MAKRGRKAHIPSFKKIKRIIQKHLEETVHVELKKFTFQLKKSLVDGIILQRFESFKKYPLTDAWVKQKVKKGHDHRVMIMTKQYLNSIRVYTHSRSHFEVNVPKNVYARGIDRKPTKITLRQLGAIHEFGSSSMNLPPRSHWKVVLAEGRQKAKTIAKTIAVKSADKINRELTRGTKKRGDK